MDDLEQLATERAEAREHPVVVVQIGDADTATVLDYEPRELPVPGDTAGDEWSDVNDEWRVRVAGVVTTD